ncbi:MAG: ABC transporter permease [Trueperaceae bacterium]|nr:MAG: ABC transporter permease [Trueperaceae bacterium]
MRSERVAERFGRARAPRAAPSLWLGVGLAALVVLAALLAPLLAPGDPFAAAGRPFLPPSAAHPFGTDDLGRDVWRAVIHGSRVSLLVGVSVAAITLVLGLAVGAIAGFVGGWLDDLLMRITEFVLVLPRFFLALVVVALFGASLGNLILVLALSGWGLTARVARAGVLAAKQREYVLAARALGAAGPRLLLRHVLPNVMAPVLAYAALQVGNAIVVEASLSFLGFGDPNAMSWGYLLNGAQAFVRRAWWLSIFPGLAIVITVLAVNLLADGVRDRRVASASNA